jgi:hypothetical protein
MKAVILTAAVAIALTAQPAQAEIRICESTLRGPAGEHTVYLEVQDGRVIYGDALWAPPRQNARANVEFPRIELNYGITDYETGARTSLRYITVIHAVRMTGTRAATAEVTFTPYTEDGERRDWPFFARARDGENTGLRNSDAIAGTIHFTSPSALEIALTAPQIETSVITNENENLATGVFLMVHRPALGQLFDHVFQQARGMARNAGRDCRALRYDEEPRSS